MTYRPDVQAIVSMFREPDEWVLRYHRPNTFNIYSEAKRQMNIPHHFKSDVIGYLAWAVRLKALRKQSRCLATPRGSQIVIAAHFCKYGDMPSPGQCVARYGLDRRSAMFYQVVHRDNLWREVHDLNVEDHSAVKNPGHKWGVMIRGWDEIIEIDLYRELVGDTPGPTECVVNLVLNAIPKANRDEAVRLAHDADQHLMFGGK